MEPEVKKTRTFTEIVGNKNASKEDEQTIPLKPISNPRLEWGNIVVVVDDDGYCRGIDELKFSIIGRLSLHRSKSIPNMMELRTKLGIIWGIQDFKVIPLGKGMFHILMYNL